MSTPISARSPREHVVTQDAPQPVTGLNERGDHPIDCLLQPLKRLVGIVHIREDLRQPLLHGPLRNGRPAPPATGESSPQLCPSAEVGTPAGRSCQRPPVDVAAESTENIRRHRRQLDPGVLENLVETSPPESVPRSTCADNESTCAAHGSASETLKLRSRQPEPDETTNPIRISQISLAARHVCRWRIQRPRAPTGPPTTYEDRIFRVHAQLPPPSS